MYYFFRLLAITLPLFSGFSLVLGMIFGMMFNSEYERLFFEKWNVVNVSIYASQIEEKNRDLIKEFLDDKGKRSLLEGFLIQDAVTGKMIYKWAKNPDVLPKSVLFSEKIEASEFRDGYGYAVFISEDKKFRYVTAASDSDREFYLSGYKKIFIATVSLGVFAGLLVPFLFSLALNSQVQKIDGKEKKFVITEFYDLNQTFRIMQESLMNIKKRNSGMLRSGISLMEKYRQQ